MSKHHRSKRRPHAAPPLTSEPSSSTSSSVPAAAGTSRLAWLLILLVGLIGLMIPAQLWYRSMMASGPLPDAAEPAPQNLLVSLPSEPVYPEVDQLRAEADQLAETLVARYPDSPSALHIAANQAAQMHQYEQAAELWQQAIELAPTSPGPQAGLGMVLMEQGQDQRAVEVLETALSRGAETAEIYQFLCQALQKLGSFDRAETVCRKGLERFGDDVALWLELGQLQLQQDKIDQAQESFQRVVQLEPATTAAYLSLATVAARSGDTDQAQRYRDLADKLQQQNPLAEVRFQAIYRASLQAIVVESLVNAAQEYLRHGELAVAEQTLLRALTLHPKNPHACRILVDLYRNQARLADAHLVQQRLVDIQPNVIHLIQLASLALQLGRDAEVEAALQAALQLDPSSLDAHRGLAFLYQKTGHLAAARDHAEHLARLQSTTDNYELLSQLCLQMGDQPAARAAAEHARRLSETKSNAGAGP